MMHYHRRRSFLSRYRRKVLFGLMTRGSQVDFVEAPQAHIHEDETLDHWEDAYQKNQTELSILLLIYLFFSDDGKISRSEYQNIKRVIKENKEQLSERARIDFAGYITNGLSIERFKEIFFQKQYSMQLLDESIRKIKVYLNHSGKLLLLVERLKESLVSASSYN